MINFLLLILTSFQLEAADLNLADINVSSAVKVEVFDVNQLAAKTKYTVYVALDKDCPILQKYIPTLNELHYKYQSSELNILLITRPSNFTLPEIEKFINTYKIKPEIYIDRDNKLLKALGIKTITQSILVDNEKMNILYNGRIDDKINYDSVKEFSKNNYLEMAIISALAGKKVKMKKIKTLGCAI